MKLTFRLRFRTNYGQSLWLTGAHPLFGDNRIEQAIPLHFVSLEYWETTIPVMAGMAPGGPVSYSYVLRNPDGSHVADWGKGRAINFSRLPADEVLIIDTWNHASYVENAFYTEPFRKVLLKGNRGEVQIPDPPAATHTFRVKAPLLTASQTLCILGDAAVLSHWNTTQPVLLGRIPGEDCLSVQLDLRQETFPIAYKYAVYDVARKAFVRYEDGDNRILQDGAGPNRHTIVNDGFVALPANTWKGGGVAIPVFSLRSERSFGVGEFSDLKLLADWCRQTGFKVIQLLPINDTSATHSWKDSYPYSAISAFALHPLYLDLGRMAEGANQRLLERLEPERRRLNSLDELDYEAVMNAKLDFVRKIYPSQMQRTFESGEYGNFFARNRHWLEPYAAFCYWRDEYGTADFNQWPAHRVFRREEIAALAGGDSPAREEIRLHYFMQYHLHLQLREATEYARSNGVIVKGDIAIGVCRNGADVWRDSELFHTEFQAGAPPDAFAARGQNWSFPTYNWFRMKQDGFAWWKSRFEQMSRYFDAFRIDHILGFFRIWSIPSHAVEGILGHFVPAVPVEAKEFAARGIWFDRDRYTRPYITDEVLLDRFENDHGEVKRMFLKPLGGGNYALKSEFATQRQVERHFAALKDSEHYRRIRQGLYDLISNVILFEVEGSEGRRFHFRFGIEETDSFRNLPPHTQRRLVELYIDYFYRRQDGLWRKEALEKLAALKAATNMLVCGEDLGMVPACLPGVMKELGLLTLEVQRMPKVLNREFSRPREAPYLSVVTPSTHDMSTIRGWWEEDRERTRKFYREELGHSGHPPRHCEPSISKAIVRQHLDSPAMWSIFQLQDLLGMNAKLRRPDIAVERINQPDQPGFYWRYRMHLTLEQLLQAEDFNRELKESVRQTGRGGQW